jgi:hypothetical protein
MQVGLTITFILSSCIAEDLAHMAEIHGLLPANHFGCRLGHTTTDTFHYIIKFIKDAWHRQKIVSVLYLDVKGAFPSVLFD